MTTAVAAIQTKHKSEMFGLWEMIEKSLLLTDSASATPLPDPDAAPKALSGGDSLLKTSIEK